MSFSKDFGYKCIETFVIAKLKLRSFTFVMIEVYGIKFQIASNHVKLYIFY